jgi:TolB protein
MKRILFLAAGLMALLAIVLAQQSPDIKGIIRKETERPQLAVPDLRGSGAAQQFMGAFNQTLWSDLANAGLFRMAPKTSYPMGVPQQPSDFKEPPTEQPQPAPARGRGRRQAAPLPRPTTGGGYWMQDWSSPPVQANYLAFGYTAVQNDVLVLMGWLYDLGMVTPARAQVIGKRYLGTVDAAGARKIAHEFAADILQQFGGKSLMGTKIYFISDRTGTKEVWVMDADGQNQKQITKFRSITIMPAVSPDGSRIAFTSYYRGNPAIFVFSVDPLRQLPFYNQVASMNATPDFTPDGKQIVFSSTASGWAQIYVANLNGSGLKRISSTRAIEVEPKVNPKTGSEMVFVSGRSGPQQIYRMNMDGANVERLTPGEGEASNPCWHPDGQLIAYSWTRGYATGNFNVFVMDPATRGYNQLTHGQGRNENPSWAPDGKHIVFMSTRSGSPQIWSMLADGSQLQRLTTQGKNWTPVWGK